MAKWTSCPLILTLAGSLCSLVGCQPVSQPGVTFRVEKVDPSKREWLFQIVFENAPPYIHALPMAPSEREPELNRGRWLVLAWGVSSQTDKNCIDAAVRGAARYDGAVHLGVRPFVDDKEMQTWFPEYRGEFGSPLWMVLKDGRVQKWEARPFDDEELKAFLDQALH